MSPELSMYLFDLVMVENRGKPWNLFPSKKNFYKLPDETQVLICLDESSFCSLQMSRCQRSLESKTDLGPGWKLQVLLKLLGAISVGQFYHRYCSIHIERACQLHGAIMAQHGLLHKGFHISWLSWMDLYKRKFWLDQEQPNLGNADVKQNIACMHPWPACTHSLYVYTVISMIGNSFWQRQHCLARS